MNEIVNKFLLPGCFYFDTSNFELDRPLPKQKNKEVIGLMKHELGRKIMKEIFGDCISR